MFCADDSKEHPSELRHHLLYQTFTSGNHPFRILVSISPLHVRSFGLTSSEKVWICLFTCLVTRAVHLDVVTDLSTETFIQCLKRFAARRGIPQRFSQTTEKHLKQPHSSSGQCSRRKPCRITCLGGVLSEPSTLRRLHGGEEHLSEW